MGNLLPTVRLPNNPLPVNTVGNKLPTLRHPNNPLPANEEHTVGNKLPTVWHLLTHPWVNYPLSINIEAGQNSQCQTIAA